MGAGLGRSGLWNLLNRPVLLRLVVRGALLTVLVNLAGLVSPLFFTQVYNRVLTTGSGATLLALTIGTLIVVGLGVAFDQLRTVSFVRLGANVYCDLEPYVFRASHVATLEGVSGRRTRPLDDLETVRGFLSGSLPGAMLDLMFAPLLLAVLYMTNEWLGHFALLALVSMAAIAALTQWVIGASLKEAGDASQKAMSLAESHLRAAEAAEAMGYSEQTMARWASANRLAVGASIRSTAESGGLAATAKAVRSGAQILVIALAAMLALEQRMSPGAIVAASIILGRLVSPIDVFMASWRQIGSVRLAADRLERLLARPIPTPPPAVAKPRGHLAIDGLAAATPDGAPILRGVSFAALPGETIAIVGPAGAGKSTLLRCIVGVWPRVAGVVRLDEVVLAGDNRKAVAPWIGFLPQNADLAPGSIGDNIGRFSDASTEDVTAAVVAAGAEGIIASLPRGLDSETGEAGVQLSAGQRRRIALARALFGKPSLVILDEPEAHLDGEGEQALIRAMKDLKATGATVLIAAHRPSIVSTADKILVLKDGKLIQFGPAAEVLASITQPPLRRVGP